MLPPNEQQQEQQRELPRARKPIPEYLVEELKSRAAALDLGVKFLRGDFGCVFTQGVGEISGVFYHGYSARAWLFGYGRGIEEVPEALAEARRLSEIQRREEEAKTSVVHILCTGQTWHCFLVRGSSRHRLEHPKLPALRLTTAVLLAVQELGSSTTIRVFGKDEVELTRKQIAEAIEGQR